MSPFDCSTLRWSTVIWRISAFSSLADPDFSSAVGTSCFSSLSEVLMRSLRRFSMTPLLRLRVDPPPAEAEEWCSVDPLTTSSEKPSSSSGREGLLWPWCGWER